jgi:hypothetical protein
MEYTGQIRKRLFGAFSTSTRYGPMASSGPVRPLSCVRRDWDFRRTDSESGSCLWIFCGPQPPVLQQQASRWGFQKSDASARKFLSLPPSRQSQPEGSQAFLKDRSDKNDDRMRYYTADPHFGHATSSTRPLQSIRRSTRMGRRTYAASDERDTPSGN